MLDSTRPSSLSSSQCAYHATNRDGSPSRSSSMNIASNDSGSSSGRSPVVLFETTLQSSSCVQQKKRQWAMLLFSLTTVLLFADQNLMAPNLTAIAEEFGFTDEERDVKLGGNIALAFWILGAPAAIVVGCLADHCNRSILFACTVGIGEGACFLTYFTTTYWELYLCRAVTGFSIGGALPLIYSILGDLFRAEERHIVNACVSMGTGLGITLGQGIAGFFGPTFGWRLPFLVVATPALACAVAVLTTVEDPERGAMEQAVLAKHQSTSYNNRDNDDEDGEQLIHHPTAEKAIEMQRLSAEKHIDANYNNPNKPPVPEMASFTIGVRRRSSQSSERRSLCADDGSATKNRNLNHEIDGGWYSRKIAPLFQDLAYLLKTPTVVLGFFQGAPGCLPWGIVNTYLNDFLSEDRGMSVEFATFVILCFGVGTFFGMLLGGAGGRYLYMVDKRYPALLAGSASIFACVPFWVLLNDVDNNTSFLFIAATTFAGGLSSGVTGCIIKATVQNVTLPTMRGTAFALFNTFDDFGRGLGPVFLAQMIVSMGGRTAAFNAGTFGWMACGILNLLVFFTAESDEERTQATIAANLSKRVVLTEVC